MHKELIDPGFVVMRDVVSKDLLEVMANYMRLYRDRLDHENKITLKKTQNVDIPQDTHLLYDDTLVTDAFSTYCPLISEALHQYLEPIMLEVTGKELVPTFSYTRIYYNGAEMPAHKDRPECEYSITFCVKAENDNPWSIFFGDDNGVAHDLVLNTGDMCIYRGPDLLHWRNKYDGEEQIQFFMHWIDKNGENYPELAYDGRLGRGFPKVNPNHGLNGIGWK
jgi:hypothetical protein